MALISEHIQTLMDLQTILDDILCPACSHRGLDLTVRILHTNPFGMICNGCNTIYDQTNLPEILLAQKGA